MNETKLTDLQRRALLQGEVAKLQAAGMDHRRAFETAYEGHPEWRVVAPLAGQSRDRRTGQLANTHGQTTGGPERTAEIQRLVAAYQASHPNTAYDVAFSAVLRDPANKKLADLLHKPQRAFKPTQINRGAGVNTPPRKPEPKTAALRYGPGIPPRRLDEAKAQTE
jgi:hypothetical protein